MSSSYFPVSIAETAEISIFDKFFKIRILAEGPPTKAVHSQFTLDFLK